MVAADEDALICDFAETYHIYQWRGLAVKYAAVLAFGLSDDSRIKMALTGRKVSLDRLLMASAVDALNLLVWSKTKDAQKHRNQPKSVFKMLTEEQDESEKLLSFDSAEEFERKRRELLKGA